MLNFNPNISLQSTFLLCHFEITVLLEGVGKNFPATFHVIFNHLNCFLLHSLYEKSSFIFARLTFQIVISVQTDFILMSDLVKYATDGMQWLVNSLVGSTSTEPVHVCNLRNVPTFTSPPPPSSLLFPIMQITLLVGPQHWYSSCGRGGVFLAEVVSGTHGLFCARCQ